MATLEQVFSPQNLIAQVSAFGEESNAATPIADMFQRGVRKTVFGTTVTWDREDYSRAIAPFGSDLAPSIRRFAEDRAQKVRGIAQVRISRTITAKEIFVHRRALGELAPNAEAEVARHVRALTYEMRRAREYYCAELIANKTGATINAANIPGSTATFSHDPVTKDFTANAAWSTAGTKILSGSLELTKAIEDYLSNCGLTPSRALINMALHRMLMGNTEVQAWFQHLQIGTALAATGLGFGEGGGFGLGGGLAGIPNWLRFDHGYKNSGGSFTKYFANDYAILLPPTDDIFGFAEGYDVIPEKAIGAGTSPNELASLSPAGMFVYAYLESYDPVSIKLVGVDNFAPEILFPEAVMIIDPTPTP